MKTTLSVLFFLGAICSIAQKDGNFHLNKEYAISPAGTIRLKTSDARVTIIGSARKSAHVKIDREVTVRGISFGKRDFNVKVEEIGGNVEISEMPHTVNFGIVGYYNEKYTVLIEVPEGTGLTLRGDDGTYSISNISGAIALRTTDSDVKLTNCKGDNFAFLMRDGELQMDQGRGKLEFQGSDTHVHIQNATLTDIHADLGDGNLIIETVLSDNGNYSIRAHDGLVSFSVLGGGGTFDVRHDDGRVTTEGAFQLLEKSEDEMRLTLASGKANVNIRTDDARVKLVAR